jgi:hypothetical protein
MYIMKKTNREWRRVTKPFKKFWDLVFLAKL